MTIAVQSQLLSALEKIDRPGTFCTSGRLEAVLPGLEVEGEGPIALPLTTQQAASVIEQAHQAPYGKGEQTLVDTDVRRVWEIDADQVAFANPEWPNVVQQAVAAAQSELGLEKQKLSPHLYKLLLYEPGSFFLPHRDGEKLDRMVATLIIALPSAHEGGELIVRHEGREVVVDFGPDSRFHTQFAAFYADCEHEIQPVKSGYRLAVVYNLTLGKSKRTIKAPTSGEHIDEIAEILRNWTGRKWKTPRAGEQPSSPKLAVLLDHKYSQAGLAFDVLKGVDRAKSDVLFEAARQAGYDASLALVTYWESGSAEPTDDYAHYGGRYGRYGYDDDEEDEEDDGSDYVMGEVFDESLTAEHFSDSDGNPLGFGKIFLDDDDIVSQSEIGEGPPDHEDFEGYTGNAGMTLERWYHRAAVMLWPSASRFDVLCETGVGSAVGGLARMVREWKHAKKSEQPALKEQCLEFARRIIERWPTREWRGGYYYGEYGGDRDGGKAEPVSLPSLLEQLDDVSLISQWIRGVLAKDFTVDPGKTLGDVCKRHGWRTFQTELQPLFENTSNETIERDAQLLADWSLRKDKDADRKKLCTQFAKDLLSAFESWDPQQAARNFQARKVDRSELLPPLAQSCIALEQNGLLNRLVGHVLDRPEIFDFTTVQIPALLSLQTWLKRNVEQPCAPLKRWLTGVVREFESRAAQPPQEPADWRRETHTSCKCADCKELIAFLKNPDQKTLRLPLAKERRRHLHNIIDTNHLDLTHVTERRGRPFTLVCTKTQASYERALKAHQVDLDHLQKMQKLRDWHESLG